MQSIGMLRTVNEEELELMLSWRNAPSVRENMYTRHVISIDEHLAWWNKIKSREDTKYLMYELSGVPLGIVGFNLIDRFHQNAFWAFYASPDAPRGTGIFMEFLALDYAFHVLNLHKLSCEVLAFNSSVIKLHQKFGFTVEGVFREHHNVDDKFEDIFRLGVLKKEWLTLRIKMQEKLEKINRH